MKALIIANGTCETNLPDPALFDRVIAVDGGGKYAAQADIKPDIVIGDGDSLPQALQQKWRIQGIPFHTFPEEKDQTDLEIALLWAQEHGMTEGVVYGALGGRIDQSMANMLLLADERFAACQLTFIHQRTSIHCVRSVAVLHEAVGDKLSLLQAGEESPLVTIRGCQYSLEKMPLKHTTHGISNIVTASPARVIIHKGKLFVFHLPCMGKKRAGVP
ncbi:MAG: thiamine diphosphokinase [Holosporales bacterium]|nr:thiamine diphosphokinase [Holosporales bacterium]